MKHAERVAAGLRDGEVAPTCSWDGCTAPTNYVDSVPDADKTGYSAAECGYVLVPLCWFHARERTNTSRVQPAIVDESVTPPVGRAYFGGGVNVFCPDCGRQGRDHPYIRGTDCYRKLCDGSACAGPGGI